MWILISWLLQKTADLDLNSFRLSLYRSCILFTKEFILYMISAQLGSTCKCIICPLAQVKFSLYKYIMGIYMSFAISTPLHIIQYLSLEKLVFFLLLMSGSLDKSNNSHASPIFEGGGGGGKIAGNVANSKQYDIFMPVTCHQ